MSIKPAISSYLKDHGITQAFVARKCGWSRQRINAILTGKQHLRFDDAAAICDALGLPCDYFHNAAKTVVISMDGKEISRVVYHCPDNPD